MIQLTKMSRDLITINHSYIETIEETPDTVITLASGKKIIVIESCKEILDKIAKTHYNGKV